MDLARVIKWIVIALVLFFAWRFLSPYLKSGSSTGSTSGDSGFVNSSCIGAADKAAQAWGSGVGRFVNPPYDADAFSVFRSDVDTKIANAEGQCACVAESCRKIQSAMRDLRNLAGDLESSIRNGTPPGSDLVQRQEAIDRQLDEARDLIKEGK